MVQDEKRWKQRLQLPVPGHLVLRGWHILPHHRWQTWGRSPKLYRRVTSKNDLKQDTRTWGTAWKPVLMGKHWSTEGQGYSMI